MESVRQIENLIYRYAEMMDSGDFAGVAALFDAATYRAAQGPAIVGSRDLEAVLRAMVRLYEGRPRTQHLTTNVSVEIAPDGFSATSRSCFTVVQGLADFPLQVIVTGTYRDRFLRGAQGWRFSERVVSMDLVGDLSRHLRGHFARSR